MTAPPVTTLYGKLQGAQEDGVNVWRGIPFAAPPVGELRFRAPQPPQPWSSVRAAVEFGPVSHQPVSTSSTRFGGLSPVYSEDCLYLNVWTDRESIARVWGTDAGTSAPTGTLDAGATLGTRSPDRRRLGAVLASIPTARRPVESVVGWGSRSKARAGAKPLSHRDSWKPERPMVWHVWAEALDPLSLVRLACLVGLCLALAGCAVEPECRLRTVAPEDAAMADYSLFEVEPGHWVGCWRTEYVANHPPSRPDLDFHRHGRPSIVSSQDGVA